MDDNFKDSFVTTQCLSIVDAMNRDDAIAVFNNCQVLFGLFNDDFKVDKKIKPVEDKINKILVDNEKMRRLYLLQRIKSEVETSIEYYYKDRGRDDRLFYAENLENECRNLYTEIRKCLTIILSNSGAISLD
jgi:hypothetical protein